MDLEAVQLTRRNFLKLVGAAAAGAAVPALHLPVEGPAQYNDLAGLTGGSAPRTRFLHPSLAMVGGEFVTATIVVDHSARGPGTLRLWWTGAGEAEFGWWADYWEINEGALGQAVSPIVAMPETVGKFQALGPDIVNRDDLGQLEMLPGKLLNISLYAPWMAEPCRWESHGGLDGWNVGGKMIHGLELQYEA